MKNKTISTQKPREDEATSHYSRNDYRSQLLTGLPVTERRLSLAGISTPILEGGDGPPVILLHGPGESATWWLRVIPNMVMTNKIIVPDLPGHGASEVDGKLKATQILPWLNALIWGRLDRANKLKIAEHASKHYGWPLQVIENTRDDPKLERPEAFVDALNKILDGLRPEK